HELRNPLGIIRNAAYFLRVSQKELSQDAKDAFDELERGLATSNRLVSELLDYVREPKRQETEFPITSAIDEALAGIEIPAAVRLVRPAGQDDVVCRANKEQIVQIIDNLIRNSVDAMPEGGDLKLSAMHQENDVVMEITDSGSGIAATDLEKIFEPLFSRKTKGIGLGLAVSRRYAELNHGNLEVISSVPGCGATFRLTLPAPEPTEIES
ncbi:MAG: HAMP domain-containing sensor histidine kinase, partial [Planctomycetota bacterium]|nr:HAMP domain-containing sensor histidine kinase [Planctomycetota bacterium]